MTGAGARVTGCSSFVFPWGGNDFKMSRKHTTSEPNPIWQQRAVAWANQTNKQTNNIINKQTNYIINLLLTGGKMHQYEFNKNDE